MTDLPAMKPSAEERARSLIADWFKRHTSFQHIEGEMADVIEAAYRDGAAAERARILAKVQALVHFCEALQAEYQQRFDAHFGNYIDDFPH